jgi:2-hydroxy-6-oxonona-2,4-dienedioate hydrolase
MLKKMTRAGVLSNDKEDTRKRLRAVVNNPDKLAEEMVDVRYAVYHRPTFAAALDSLLALTDRDTYLRWSLTPEILAKIRSEVLVIYGDNDKGEGVSEGRFLVDGVERVKSVIFMGAGHWPPYERPAEYAQVALAFLDGGLAAVTSGTVE